MNRARVFVLAAGLATLILCALQITGTARASVPQPLVTFTYQRIDTTDPGRVWFDQHGMHIRDRVDFGLLSGGIQGSARVVYNADLVYSIWWARLGEPAPMPMPEDGVAYGTIEFFSGPPDSAVPSWQGSWSYELKNGSIMGGKLTATNPARSQMLVVFSVIQDGSGIVHTGYIDPLYCPVAVCKDWPKE